MLREVTLPAIEVKKPHRGKQGGVALFAAVFRAHGSGSRNAKYSMAVQTESERRSWSGASSVRGVTG